MDAIRHTPYRRGTYDRTDTYTREFKEQAVSMVLEDGLSQIETAESRIPRKESAPRSQIMANLLRKMY